MFEELIHCHQSNKQINKNLPTHPKQCNIATGDFLPFSYRPMKIHGDSDSPTPMLQQYTLPSSAINIHLILYLFVSCPFPTLDWELLKSIHLHDLNTNKNIWDFLVLKYF